jgi:mono/diheme cytochrome c family protein
MTRVVNELMKRFGIALLIAAAGFFVFHAKQAPIYAASVGGGAQAASAGSAAAAHGHGEQVYQNNCSICHGEKLEGNLPAFPPLAGIHRQLSDEQITNTVHHGKGRMPAFTKLSDEDLTALLHFLDNSAAVATTAGSGTEAPGASHFSSKAAENGNNTFQQNCAFCHGKDAQGGETGPDLTRSKLVASDRGGDKISEVVRDGRPQKGMPHFNFADAELHDLIVFIHEQRAKANSKVGGRRGVDVSDLQTGNAEQGKAYFEGAGGCSKCHSPTGDLAHVASRYEGLELERRMLYPEDAKSKVTVTLKSGEKVTGTLAYLDEFTVGLHDATGTYRSWSIPTIKYTIDSPVEAHVDQFPKYSDADIHNLMAYIQTLK